MTVVRVANLRKVYLAVVAVDDVSFDVQQGEIFGLLGPNGAGKTTTLACIEGLRRIDGGSISVLGLDPHRDARRRLPGLDALVSDAGRFTLRGRGEDFVTDVIQCLAEHRIKVNDFRTEVPTLEDVFLRLTGHSIRD